MEICLFRVESNLIDVSRLNRLSNKSADFQNLQWNNRNYVSEFYFRVIDRSLRFVTPSFLETC